MGIQTAVRSGEGGGTSALGMAQQAAAGNGIPTMPAFMMKGWHFVDLWMPVRNQGK